MKKNSEYNVPCCICLTNICSGSEEEVKNLKYVSSSRQTNVELNNTPFLRQKRCAVLKDVMLKRGINNAWTIMVKGKLSPPVLVTVPGCCQRGRLMQLGPAVQLEVCAECWTWLHLQSVNILTRSSDNANIMDSTMSSLATILGNRWDYVHVAHLENTNDQLHP